MNDSLYTLSDTIWQMFLEVVTRLLSFQKRSELCSRQIQNCYWKHVWSSAWLTLRYDPTVFHTRHDLNTDINCRRCITTKEAYYMFKWTLPGASSNMPNWRTTKYSDICANSTAMVNKKLSFDGSEFSYENRPAKQAYQNCRKYIFNKPNGAIVFSLFRLDTSKNSIIDELHCPEDAVASHTINCDILPAFLHLDCQLSCH